MQEVFALCFLTFSFTFLGNKINTGLLLGQWSPGYPGNKLLKRQRQSNPPSPIRKHLAVPPVLYISVISRSLKQHFKRRKALPKGCSIYYLENPVPPIQPLAFLPLNLSQAMRIIALIHPTHQKSGQMVAYATPFPFHSLQPTRNTFDSWLAATIPNRRSSSFSINIHKPHPKNKAMLKSSF